MSLDDELKKSLHERKTQAQYRTRRVSEAVQATKIVVDGKRVLNFCSNDYLGLASHPEVIRAFKTATDDFGVGSGASHLINGHTRYHHELEEALAEFTGRPRALLFSTGYMANLGVISALLGKGDHVFEDRLNHASLLDAGLLSQARLQRYQHNDIKDLSNKISSCKAKRRLVVTDGVFSMDGDLAPIDKLCALTQKENLALMVDDAHGFGVLGQHGGGIVEHYGLDIEQVPILMGTLGKAFGTFGAFVAGSEALIETLIQQARSYVYTTAAPAAIAAASLASLKLVREENWRREKLTTLIERFRNGAQQLGLRLVNSETAIQPVVIGDNSKAMDLSAALFDAGVMVSAIRPPTVPEGTARLRVTFSAAHSETQVDNLLEALQQCQLRVLSK